ncbi:hypothetical protein [Malikia spinosa]|uniref:hypothetical protein n=1 Tax=Malikia spinosa TaxID=86180 RepID=UPI0011B0E5D4|nr:hypothetical protein [Malikia spinosa]
MSPYIGLGYLKRIVGISSSWKLISDLDEWLAAAPRNERPLIHDFLDVNRDQVRHYSGVHAKTVIGPLAAYVGSANLTLRGLLSRVELGFRVETTEHLDELHRWFDDLWNQATFAEMKDVQHVIDHLDLQPNRLDNEKVVTVGRSIRSTRARLVRLESTETQKTKQVQEVNSKNSIPKLKKTEIHEAEEPIVQLPRIRARFTGSDDIEEFLHYVDIYATSGFSFSQALAHLRSRGLRITAAQLYFDILPLCANRVRSVFSTETVNRLIYTDGRFIQSNKQLLDKVQTPFDAFLRNIVRRLDFKESRPLELGKELADNQEITQHEQKILIESLLKNNLLIRGDGFRLNESWQWTSRFKLFNKSHHDWETKYRVFMLYREEVADVKTAFPEPLVESKKLQTDLINQIDNSEDGRVHYIRSNLVRKNEAHDQVILNNLTSFYDHREKIRNAELDEVFTQLCKLVSSSGSLLRMSMKELIGELINGRSLQKSDVSSAISGKLRFKSPLIVKVSNVHEGCLVIQPGNQSNIVLEIFPKTACAISKTPACQSPTARIIKATGEAHDVLKELLEKADSNYLAMCKEIEIKKWKQKSSSKNLLSFTGQDMPLQHYQNIQNLLLKAPESFPHLFRIKKNVGSSVSIIMDRDHLWRFPLTKAYIEQNKLKKTDSQNLTSFANQIEKSQIIKVKCNQTTILSLNKNPSENSIPAGSSNQESSTKSPYRKHELKIKADELFSQLIKLAISHGNPIENKGTKESRLAISEVNTINLNLATVILKSRPKIPKIIDAKTKAGITIITYNPQYFGQLKEYPLTNESMKAGFFLLKKTGEENQEAEIQT